MARYSSDSDSDRSGRHRRKHYGRSTRSSSGDSSDSCSYKKRSSKYSRSRRRRRSKSGEREAATSKNYKSSSTKDTDKGRRRRAKKSSSRSPDRNGRRKTGCSSPSGKSAQPRSGAKPSLDKTTGPSFKDDFIIEPRIKESILEEINAEGFAPKSFSSSGPRDDDKFRNVVVDVSAETIKAPPVKDLHDVAESIFHASITSDRQARLDKWVKKLYTLRQKAISDATHASVT